MPIKRTPSIFIYSYEMQIAIHFSCFHIQRCTCFETLSGSYEKTDELCSLVCSSSNEPDPFRPSLSCFRIDQGLCMGEVIDSLAHSLIWSIVALLSQPHLCLLLADVSDQPENSEQPLEWPSLGRRSADVQLLLWRNYRPITQSTRLMIIRPSIAAKWGRQTIQQQGYSSFEETDSPPQFSQKYNNGTCFDTIRPGSATHAEQ